MADRGKWGKLCALCCNGLRFVNGRSSGRFSALFEIHPNNRVRSIENEKKNSLYSSSSLASLSNSTTVHSIPHSIRGAMLFQFSFLFLSRGVSKPGEKRERKKERKKRRSLLFPRIMTHPEQSDIRKVTYRRHTYCERLQKGFVAFSNPKPATPFVSFSLFFFSLLCDARAIHYSGVLHR